MVHDPKFDFLDRVKTMLMFQYEQISPGGNDKVKQNREPEKSNHITRVTKRHKTPSMELHSKFESMGSHLEFESMDEHSPEITEIKKDIKPLKISMKKADNFHREFEPRLDFLDENQELRHRSTATNFDNVEQNDEGIDGCSDASFDMTSRDEMSDDGGESQSAETTLEARYSLDTMDGINVDGNSSVGPHSIMRTRSFGVIAKEVSEIKLLAYASLPEWLRINDLLQTSHRPPMPCLLSCFRSMCSLHSETVNIWTHLIGFLILVAITLCFFIRPDNVSYSWYQVFVFLAFFVTAQVCMTISWLYHTLYCHSRHVNNLLSKLDFSGIAIFILGSFVSWLCYGFYCDKLLMIFYITSMSVLALCCIVFSSWEKFADEMYRPLRAVTFTGLGLAGTVPIVHAWLKNGPDSTNIVGTATTAMLYIGGAVVYALRVPERFFPGKFDIWGHSHQIFHVFVVMAAVMHYRMIKTMADYRNTVGECHHELDIDCGPHGST